MYIPTLSELQHVLLSAALSKELTCCRGDVRDHDAPPSPPPPASSPPRVRLPPPSFPPLPPSSPPPPSELEKRSKLELLGTLAFGLNDVCDRLQKLLDIAPKIPVSRVRKPFDYGGYIDLQLRCLVDSVREDGDVSMNRGLNAVESKHLKLMDHILRGLSYTYLPGYAIIQKDTSAPYVADCIAKLLLELLWRCVAACEVRPGPGILFLTSARTSELIASIMLHFTQVDSEMRWKPSASNPSTTSSLSLYLAVADLPRALANLSTGANLFPTTKAVAEALKRQQ